MYKDRITVDPEIMVGKPIVKGTRITVEAILKKLAEGCTVEEAVECFPTINQDDVLAALSYAAEVICSEEIID